MGERREREIHERNLARGFLDVLSAARPDLAWQIDVIDGDRRRPLATRPGQPFGLEAAPDEAEPLAAPDPDHAEQAA